MSWRDYLPNTMQAQIASQEYQNAESDINKFQGLNQNIESYRSALQEAQQAKFVAGEQYMSAVNSIRAASGKEPYAGWPEEAMGNSRRVYPAIDRMGYPLTPEQEAMYAQASPRRVVPVSQDEMQQIKDAQALQNAGEMAPATYQDTSDTGGSTTSPSRVQFLGGRMEGQPKAPKQSKEAKQPDFVRVSNTKQETRKLTPREMYDIYMANGEIGEANELKYNIQKETYDRNIAKIQKATDQIAEIDGAEKADRFNILYTRLAKEKFQAKPIEETEAFKTAQTYVNRAGFHQNRASVAMLGEELAEGKRMLEAGASKESVVAYLSANIPKLIQSLATGQSDAVQEAEARRLMPELMSIFSNGFDVNAALKLGDQKEWSKWFSKQPEDFIKKGERIFSAAVKVQNNSSQQYVKQIGRRAADSLLLTEIPTDIKAGGGNVYFEIRQKLAMIRPPQQQGAQQGGQPVMPPAPVQTRIGTPVQSKVQPSSFWPVFGTDTFGK